jgi:prepilin-type N-terminal cleavage/methylation domain-containing protein
MTTKGIAGRKGLNPNLLAHFSRFMKPEGQIRPDRSVRSAFTLPEILITVVMLGILVVSLYAGLSAGFTLVQLSREDLRATQVLMEKLEAVRLCTWNQLANFPRSFQQRFDPVSKNNSASAFVYHGTVSIEPPGAIPDSAPYKSNMRLVTVALYWTNQHGSDSVVRTRQMQTEVARYGQQNYLWGSKP